MSSGCYGCRIVRAAFPAAGSECWGLVAGLLEVGARCSITDPVVVLGTPELLPESLRGRGQRAMLVKSRAELLSEQEGTPLARVLGPLVDPPPAGRAWVLASIGDRSSGAVILLHHPVAAEVPPRLRVLLELSLVPEDGGPCLGALSGFGGYESTKGGAA